MGLITREGLILASALGGNGGQQELGWPFIIHYDKLLSIDNGTLNQHEDVTGGLRAYVNGTASIIAQSMLGNTGWSSSTYTMSSCGMLETIARIDMTNIAQIRLRYSGTTRSAIMMQYRAAISDNWSTIDSSQSVIRDGASVIDTSGITGFMYIRFYNNVQYDSTLCTVDEISVVPGPYLYRTGDPVVGITGGWFSPPAVPTSPQLRVTQDADRIRAYQIASLSTTQYYMDCLATKDLVDLASIAAIHCVVTNNINFMVPGIRLYDENWNRVASLHGANAYARYTAPTDVTIGVSSYTGKYHIGLGVFEYNATNLDKYMDLYSMYMEKAAS